MNPWRRNHNPTPCSVMSTPTMEGIGRSAREVVELVGGEGVTEGALGQGVRRHGSRRLIGGGGDQGCRSWLTRRLRGRSSGDNRTGKHPTWTTVEALPRV
ncbi:hypothetical protein GCM10027184_76860 [Saccharothrix stipae]